jgi:hypothetical protein
MTAGEVVTYVPTSQLVYLVGDNYDNTHREFEYMEFMLTRMGFTNPSKVSKPKGRQWQMSTWNGCRILTVSVQRGAEQIITRGEEPNIIALVEAGVIESMAIMYASIQRLTRSRGRLILSGTMRDPFSWYTKIRSELQVDGNSWQGATFSLPAWVNREKYPGGRQDPQILKLEAILPDDMFAMTVAATIVPSKALVLPEFNYGDHVQPCPYDEQLPTEVWVDPGYFPSSYAVVVVQWHGDVAWQIDEVYENWKTDEEIIEECKNREWWPSVRSLVMDKAASQHNTRSQKSPAEVWETELSLSAMSTALGVLDGIARHRVALKQKHIRHDPECKKTLEEYIRYRKPTDNNGEVRSETPEDKDNHSMKAIAYGIVKRLGLSRQRKRAPYGVRQIHNPWTAYR